MKSTEPVNVTKNYEASWIAPDTDESMGIQRRRISTIGLIGVTLPFIAWMLDRFHDTACFRVSLSHYYYAPLSGDVFVMALVVAGSLMVAYRGETPNINLLSTIGGISAICIGLFPTEGVGCTNGTFDVRSFGDLAIKDGLMVDATTQAGFVAFQGVGIAHYVAASTLFLLMFHFCWNVFRQIGPDDIDPTTGQLTKVKALRNGIYAFCSGVILAVVLAFVYRFAAQPEWWNARNMTFWLETAGLFAFGLAWLFKGRFFNARLLGP